MTNNNKKASTSKVKVQAKPKITVNINKSPKGNARRKGC